nr:MAG TPA_asm: hypothetical protein [Caudoviricetes sp.]
MQLYYRTNGLLHTSFDLVFIRQWSLIIARSLMNCSMFP